MFRDLLAQVWLSSIQHTDAMSSVWLLESDDEAGDESNGSGNPWLVEDSHMHGVGLLERRHKKSW